MSLAPASHMIYRDSCTAFDDILPRVASPSRTSTVHLHATSPLPNITIHPPSEESKMAAARGPGLLDLPAELDHLIAQHLDMLDLMRMRITCSALHAAIPPLSLSELLELERTVFDHESDPYICFDCKRLRPRRKFADSMVKSKRSKLSIYQDVRKRFCIDCGISRGGRYTPGSHIVVFREQFVVCRSCWEFRKAAVEDGRNTSECLRCWTIPGAREQNIRRIEEERRAREVGSAYRPGSC